MQVQLQKQVCKFGKNKQSASQTIVQTIPEYAHKMK